VSSPFSKFSFLVSLPPCCLCFFSRDYTFPFYFSEGFQADFSKPPSSKPFLRHFNFFLSSSRSGQGTALTRLPPQPLRVSCFSFFSLLRDFRAWRLVHRFDPEDSFAVLYGRSALHRFLKQLFFPFYLLKFHFPLPALPHERRQVGGCIIRTHPIDAGFELNATTRDLVVCLKWLV